MSAKIDVGDTVCVNFNTAQITLCSRAIVLFMPCHPYDSWGFKDLETNIVHYISEGCTISLIEKATK